MKSKMIYLAALFAVMLFAGGAVSAGEYMIEYTYQLVTGSPETVIRSLRSFCDGKNGYVQFFSNDRAELRVPHASMSELKALLAENGYINDERMQRKDVSETVMELKTSLRARESHLTSLYAVLEGEGMQQTLEVEQEVNKVVRDIESLKGKLSYYDEKSSLADVKVVLIRTSDAVTQKSAAVPWDWVRRLGVEALLKAY
jgi:hypothetical protein